LCAKFLFFVINFQINKKAGIDPCFYIIINGKFLLSDFEYAEIKFRFCSASSESRSGKSEEAI